jgi:spore coat protein U-like protein
MRLRTLRLPTFLASTSLAGALLMSAPANAEATANLDVTASVAANCTISTAAVGFGAYDPIVTHKASPLESTGTVTVTCTNGSAVTVTLGQGANSDVGSTDDLPLRRMTDGVAFLDYELFSNLGRTAIWGGTAETDVPHTGTGAAANLVVYGRVAADQQVPTGDYEDVVVATVTF